MSAPAQAGNKGGRVRGALGDRRVCSMARGASRFALGLGFTLVAAQITAGSAEAGISAFDVAGLAFAQHPGRALPGDAGLVDEAGRSVDLSQLFGTKPVIVVLEYLRCPNLCGLVLGGLAEALAAGPVNPGAYRVLAIGIDPNERPADARASRADYTQRYGAAALASWDFLTGPEPEVRRIAEAVGFPYRYDEAIGQYAHPAGIVVATPKGLVSRYLLGVAPDPAVLKVALGDAAAGSVAVPAVPLLLVCYDYDPATGSYSFSIMRLLRWAGALTIALGGGLLAAQWRRERRRSRAA